MNTSKFLSLVLRHAPEKIALTLDENGWANVDELITQCNKFHKKLDHALLDYVVENNDKNDSLSMKTKLKLERVKAIPFRSN